MLAACVRMRASVHATCVRPPTSCCVRALPSQATKLEKLLKEKIQGVKVVLKEKVGHGVRLPKCKASTSNPYALPLPPCCCCCCRCAATQGLL